MEQIDTNVLLNRMVQYLRKHSGEELTTAIVVKEVFRPLEDLDLMDIDFKIKELAPKRGLILDSSKYDDMIVGLPFNIPYVIVDTSKLTKDELNKYIDEHFPVEFKN